MKKWIAFMLVFMLAFVIVGCNGDSDGGDGNKVTLPTSVEVTSESSSLEVLIDSELQLTATVKPAAASQDVEWTSSDTSVATVDSTGKVRGVAAGTARITATSTKDSSKSSYVEITVKQEFAAPTGVELTGPDPATVTINAFVMLTATVSPENEASQEVIYSSSDDTIATVDQNGKVTGKQLGFVTITVQVLADTSLIDTFDLEVIERQGPVGSGDPESIVIQGEEKVIEGYSILLTATVFPEGVSQEVVWSSLSSDIATVSEDGTVTGLKEGTAYIQATSALDENVTTIFTVIVEPEPVLPEYPDLGGYEIQIMAAGHAMYEHDPFLDDYGVSDREAKKRAWTEVEEAFNTTLKVVAYPDEAPWGQSRIDWLNQNAGLGDAKTDIYVSTTEWVKVLADGGSALDVSSFYAKYGKNQMSASQKAASSYKGGLYALPTANNAGINVDKGLFYNVALVERLGLPSPAKLFNDGEWTYSRFKQYVLDANALLSEGQTVLSGKPAYFYMGMVNAAGVKIADTLTLQMRFDNGYAIDAANILRDLYVATGWGTNAWDAAVTTFNEGNSIFQAGEYWFVNTDNRWPNTLWDPAGNSRFGYVPYPYPDDKTKDDARTVSSGGAVYMQADGRQYPAGVTAEYVYWAFTEMMLRTGDILRSDPTFDEQTNMERAASNKLSDPESVKAIAFFKRNKVVFDPLYGMLSVASNLGPAIDQIVIEGADYTQTTDSIKTAYEARLLELYS